MATWDDVRRLALALPETDERSSRGGFEWRVKDKGFVWERPLRKGDIEALGDAAPDGDILGARVPDEGAKFALIADDPSVYFTTPHFNGYPAVLIQVTKVTKKQLRDAMLDGWLACAPRSLAQRYLEAGRRPAGG